MTLSAQTFTLADAVTVLTRLLKGAGVAHTTVGDAGMASAINKAVITVLNDVALPEFAGSLYKTSTPTFTSGVASLAADCMIPLALDVAGNLYVRRGLSEIVRIPQTPLVGVSEGSYCFAGNSCLMRPTPSGSPTYTIHYLAVPATLVAAGDAIEVSPQLFDSICTQAAITCLTQYPGGDPNDLGRLVQTYDALIARHTGRADKQLAKADSEAARRTIRMGMPATQSGE